MGRKKIAEAREPFSTMLKPNVIEDIKRLADKVGTTPSLMAANLIDMGLDDAKMLEKSGLLKITVFIENVAVKIKNKVIKGQKVNITDIQSID